MEKDFEELKRKHIKRDKMRNIFLNLYINLTK